MQCEECDILTDHHNLCKYQRSEVWTNISLHIDLNNHWHYIKVDNTLMMEVRFFVIYFWNNWCL